MATATSAKAVMVFTGKSVRRVLREGGSQSWRLDPHHAKRCEFIVCCRSGRSDLDPVEELPELRGSAFLVGRVSGIEQATDDGWDDRWLVKMSDFARVNIPDVWQRHGGRNPVQYSTMAALGIDPTTLTFEPMPQMEPTEDVRPSKKAGPGLTIAEAKRGLAQMFGVNEDAVEITIRG
jgi:hypothetical protein